MQVPQWAGPIPMGRRGGPIPRGWGHGTDYFLGTGLTGMSLAGGSGVTYTEVLERETFYHSNMQSQNLCDLESRWEGVSITYRLSLFVLYEAC